jgi:hypothetical protein
VGILLVFLNHVLQLELFSLFTSLRLHAGTRAFCVLFGLEFLVLLLEVFVERLSKNIVDLLSQGNLCHLELAQV